MTILKIGETDKEYIYNYTEVDEEKKSDKTIKIPKAFLTELLESLRMQEEELWAEAPGSYEDGEGYNRCVQELNKKINEASK